MGEIATTADGRDITRGFVDGLPLIPSTDTILQARGGGDYRIYDEVSRDEQVAATFQQRRLALISREWEVIPGGKKRRDKQAAEHLKEVLEHIRWDAVTDRMLFGVFYGYAVAEAVWTRDGAHVALDALKVRDRRRFGFAPTGELRLLTSRHPDGEALPDKKFWHFATGASHDDEPYGLGLAHWLYWPILFKRNGIKFWLIFLEKFGMPTGLGKFPTGATPADRAKLLAAVHAIQSDSGIIIPQGMELELLEAARSGTVDYTALHDRMNAAVSKVVLGQTMTTDAGSSRSQAEVHMDVRQDLIKADSDLVCDSFSRTIGRWLTDWNYPGAAYPRVMRRIEDEPDLKPQAERDKVIYDMGFKPKLDYIIEAYGDGWEERESTPTPPVIEKGQVTAEAAEFAAPDDIEDDLDQLLAYLSNEELDEQGRALTAPILRLAEEAPDQLLGRLADIYTEMDTNELQDQLMRILFVAEVKGRLDAEKEEG